VSVPASARIDPRAVVDPGATIGENVTVGPFCVVGADVKIGDGCVLQSHVVVQDHTELGRDNVVSPMASLGGPPQDLKYGGGETRLVVGDGNRIHEYVTFNRGTEGGGGVTRIGDRNLFMAYCHVGHDCRLGSETIYANGATLAGHVEVGDQATVGAFSGIHQFCRVASHAFIGGYSVVTQDALPYVMTVGNRAEAYGLNLVGLKRKGYDKKTISALKRCYTTLFRSGKMLNEAIDEISSELGHVPEVRYFLDFVRSSKRGVVR
jgi:UDP-N-acetylglucosamine acyltransferase